MKRGFEHYERLDTTQILERLGRVCGVRRCFSTGNSFRQALMFLENFKEEIVRLQLECGTMGWKLMQQQNAFSKERRSLSHQVRQLHGLLANTKRLGEEQAVLVNEAFENVSSQVALNSTAVAVGKRKKKRLFVLPKNRSRKISEKQGDKCATL